MAVQKDKIFNNAYYDFSIETNTISGCELKVLQSSFIADSEIESTFDSPSLEMIDKCVNSILKYYHLDKEDIKQRDITRYIKKNLNVFAPVISINALKLYDKINNSNTVMYSEVEYCFIFALMLEYLGITSESLIKKLYDRIPNKIKELIIKERNKKIPQFEKEKDKMIENARLF